MGILLRSYMFFLINHCKDTCIIKESVEWKSRRFFAWLTYFGDERKGLKGDHGGTVLRSAVEVGTLFLLFPGF